MNEQPRIVVVGGGPAGLMAAEVARAAGCEVDLYERMGSVGRKFLLAGKGGLNLTHAEPFDAFVSRYRERREPVASWLRDFDADALRTWARGLGVETFVGTSDRVFPSDLRAAPLLRGWVRRLRSQGVRFHVQQRLVAIEDGVRLVFASGDVVEPDAVVLALGGGSWPELGSDGAWTGLLGQREVAPLEPANCGFEVAWSSHFAERHAGAPLKPVAIDGRRGECVVTTHGLEGSLVYALSAEWRRAIARDGFVEVGVDLLPGRDVDPVALVPRKGRTLAEHLRRTFGLDGARAGLLYEGVARERLQDVAFLATRIKRVPLRIERPRPLAEAISTAGGVRLEVLDEGLMLQSRPGVFCAGEMLDWEAPTGGYLLTACFASGLKAGRAAAAFATQGG